MLKMSCWTLFMVTYFHTISHFSSKKCIPSYPKFKKLHKSSQAFLLHWNFTLCWEIYCFSAESIITVAAEFLLNNSYTCLSIIYLFTRTNTLNNILNKRCKPTKRRPSSRIKINSRQYLKHSNTTTVSAECMQKGTPCTIFSLKYLCGVIKLKFK